MISRARLGLSAVASIVVGLFVGEPISAQAWPFPPQVAIEILEPPTPLPSGPIRYLCYELQLTSFAADSIWVRRVEVLGDAVTPLLTLEGAELAESMGRPAPAVTVDRTVLAPASHTVLYLWIALPAGSRVPMRLLNRLTVEARKADGVARDVIARETVVRPESSLLVVGPPLRGGPWGAFSGPGNGAAHRRSTMVFDGRPVIAQRYAIDYLMTEPSGRVFSKDSTRNEDYPGYGREVIAVADGIVSTVHDGVPQNIARTTTRPDPFTLTSAIGNHVIVDIGRGRYALFAHLQPGSLRVKVGERVRRGQVLGLVGNAGNSVAPHLHFHIVDRNVPLGAEGLPYLIDGFDVLGRCETTNYRCANEPTERRTRSIPLRDQLVKFR